MRPGAACTFLLLLGVAMAGCSDEPDGEAASDPQQGEPTGATGTGSLVGVVVDDAVRPLAGANVTATGPSGTLQAVTDADGDFRFDGLAAGVYLVDVTKPLHIAHRQAVTVVEDVEPEVIRFQLTFEASQVPYANVYKLDGFYECGLYQIRVCSNVNIATWVVICAQTNICLGNVTQDQSLFFQWVEPGLDFIQTEMAWATTFETGKSMHIYIGGGSEAELKEGVGLPAYNETMGESPLMARISNHEAEDAWCRQNEQCETSQVVNESRIGTDRALLIQVDTGRYSAVDPLCGTVSPCGVGFSIQQPYTLFTITFYGYEPPVDWLFATTGETPPPPS